MNSSLANEPRACFPIHFHTNQLLYLTWVVEPCWQLCFTDLKATVWKSFIHLSVMLLQLQKVLLLATAVALWGSQGWLGIISAHFSTELDISGACVTRPVALLWARIWRSVIMTLACLSLCKYSTKTSPSPWHSYDRSRALVIDVERCKEAVRIKMASAVFKIYF